MLIISTSFLFCVLIWSIFVKKDCTSPGFFWCAIWFISSFFTLIDPYDMMRIDPKSVLLINVGIVSFLIGNIRFTKFRFKVGKINRKFMWEGDSFNRIISYVILVTTTFFNVFFLAVVLKLLANGIPYSKIRDMLFGYKGVGSLFSSSFVSTFYSWIIVPSMTLLLLILLLNLFLRQFPTWFNLMASIDLFAYVFFSSGRILVMHAVILLFFLYNYFNYKFPEKHKKKIIIVIVFGIICLLLLTFYRSKGNNEVPSIYSYFCIDYPLFSYWMNYVDETGVYYHGSALLRGFLEGVNFFIGKVGLSTPRFWEMQEIFDLIQNRWIQVFPGHYYNAYVTCFFSFYLDFGLFGIVFESFLFGKISSIIYKAVKTEKTLFSIVIYLLFVQYIFDSFIRWRLGTFSSIITLFLAFICIKIKFKRYE